VKREAACGIDVRGTSSTSVEVLESEDDDESEGAVLLAFSTASLTMGGKSSGPPTIWMKFIVRTLGPSREICLSLVCDSGCSVRAL
jgi:hypothetical protein